MDPLSLANIPTAADSNRISDSMAYVDPENQSANTIDQPSDCRNRRRHRIMACEETADWVRVEREDPLNTEDVST